MKISAYIILYWDLQFLDTIISNINDFVDEIIIVDGPYFYAVNILKELNLFYDEETKPVQMNELICKFPKIKYTYSVFNNEEEKRMYGYNACINDLILLVDTDEFVDLNMNGINTFVQTSSKWVCGANIYNMCDYNIAFNLMVKKFILFKKQHISAKHHLDYTWLVGCEQHEKNVNCMSMVPFGTIYHQTLNRNKKNTIVKFVFYTQLYNYKNHKPFRLFSQYENELLLNILTPNQLLDLFIHSQINYINVPICNDNNVLTCISSEFIDNVLTKYKNNDVEFYLVNPFIGLKNSSLFFKIHATNNITIKCKNVQSIEVTVHCILLNTPHDATNHYSFKNILNNCITIENVDNININNAYYIIIEMVCTQTMDDNLLFTIQEIV